MALTKDQLLQMTKSATSPTPAGQEGDRQSYAKNPVTGKVELLYRIGLTDENGEEIFVPESMLKSFRDAENAAYGDANKWNTRFDDLIPGLKPGNITDQRYWHSVESPSSIGGGDFFGDTILPSLAIAGVGALSGGFGLSALANGGGGMFDVANFPVGAGLDTVVGGAAAGGAQAMTQLAGSDAIETMINAVNATGSATASEAAAKLGFSSIEAALASVNPAWVTDAALAADAVAKTATNTATNTGTTGTTTTTTGAGTTGTGNMFGLPKDLVDALTKVGINVGTAAILSQLFGGDDGSEAAKTSADAAKTAANIAQDQWDYYKKNYEPVNTALINEAMAAGSPEDIARAEGRANAANTAAFDRAQKEYQSRMQSYGINPSAPAYQSGVGSVGLAEAASGVGQRTLAGDTARNLGWSKKFDVANMGKGIPSSASASAVSAANAGLNASNQLFRQNQTNVQNAGYGLEPLKNYVSKNAADWFDTPTRTWNNEDTSWGSGWKSSGDYFGTIGYKKGGLIAPHMRMKPVMLKRGGLIQRYASGGNVIDNETGEVTGPGDGTSDSIPAQIDGEQPAALSNGEFVVNEAAVNLTGAEMLEAINRAGLEKRGDAEPDEQEDEMPMQRPMQMRNGGRVNRSCYGL